MIRSRLWLAPLAVLASLLAAPGTAEAAPDFYVPPSPLPTGQHGTLIRSQPATVIAAPLAAARKIMYLSTDTHGRKIAVTGMVLVPRLAWPGRGPRPLIAYAVGTQGLGDHCAPSKLLATGLEYEEVTIGALVGRGYAVVVPDYEGLGTPGTHTYLSRTALGHAVLDSVRAAQQIPAIGTQGPVGLMGYSEGGVATAGAAELKDSYAPELNIKGAALGAAGNSAAALVRHIDGGPWAGFIGYGIAGLEAAFPDDIDLDDYLNAAGMRMVASVKDQCIWETLPAHALMKSSSLTKDGRSVGDLLSDGPLASLVEKQLRPGLVRPSMPIYYGHSKLDDIAPYGPGRELAQEWCALGGDVQFRSILSPTHIGANPEFGLNAALWLQNQFNGKPSATNCGKF